jgi:hypothetical protein
VYLIYILGLPGGEKTQADSSFLKSFDVESAGGRGVIIPHPDPREAMKFESEEAAQLFWSNTSLRAFTVRIIPEWEMDLAVRRDPMCYRCTQNEQTGDVGKIFEYDAWQGYWESAIHYFVDVDKGYEIAARDGIEPQWTTTADLKFVEQLQAHETCPPHVLHVPIEKPGLMISFEFTRRSDNQLELCHALADGYHRSIRRLVNGLPAIFYPLNILQTKEIITENVLDIISAKLDRERRSVL